MIRDMAPHRVEEVVEFDVDPTMHEKMEVKSKA